MTHSGKNAEGHQDGASTSALFSSEMSGIAIQADGSTAFVGDNVRIRSLERVNTFVTRCECESCQQGTFSNAEFVSCTVCPVGTYQDNKGSDGCKVCEAGTYSKEGSDACIACDAGTFSTDGSRCYACLGDMFYSPIGSSSAGNCTCPPDSILTDGGTKCSCDAGFRQSCGHFVIAEVSTLAGGGAGTMFSPYTDGFGTGARFSNLTSSAWMPDGKTLLVGDGSRLRSVVIASGEVQTVAGTDHGYMNGDATSAKFSGVNDVAIFGSSALVISGNAIRAVNISTGEVSTFAGSSCQDTDICATSSFQDGWSATFSSPNGIAVMPDGSGVLVADTYNYRIRVVNTSGYTSTLAGRSYDGYADGLSGPSGSATFRYPSRIAISENGKEAFVIDENRVRVVSIESGEVRTLCGSSYSGYQDGPSMLARFSNPQGIAITKDGTTALVADKSNHRIRLVNIKTGDVGTLAGVPDQGPLGAWEGAYLDGLTKEAKLNSPTFITIAPDGQSAFVMEQSGHIRILRGLRPDCKCTPCKAGTFSLAGSEACTRCPSGSYQEKQGSSSCTPCANNSYSNTSLCQPLLGWQAPAQGISSYATAANVTCDNIRISQCLRSLIDVTTNISAMEACCLCGGGSFQGATPCKCNPGYVAAVDSSCQSCLPGKYSSARGSKECGVCPPGTYSQQSAVVCSKCNPGFYQPSSEAVSLISVEFVIGTKI